MTCINSYRLTLARLQPCPIPGSPNELSTKPCSGSCGGRIQRSIWSNWLCLLVEGSVVVDPLGGYMYSFECPRSKELGEYCLNLFLICLFDLMSTARQIFNRIPGGFTKLIRPPGLVPHYCQILVRCNSGQMMKMKKTST